MATFVDVVLHQPELAAVVFGYQYGVYEDVLSRFRDFHHLINFTQGRDDAYYSLDPQLFRTSFPHINKPYRYDECPPNSINASSLCLNSQKTRDPRFPLHLAILEGDLAATQRILRCRPDLACHGAIQAAIQRDHLEIIIYLLEQRATHVPELNRNVHNQYPSEEKPCWTHYSNNLTILKKLWTHRQSSSDQDNIGCSTSIETRLLKTLVSVIAQTSPYLLHRLLNVVAGRGDLPLVKELHARGFTCTTDAMDNAAGNGHLDVVVFLHEKRTEGCSTKAMDDAAANGHLDVVTFLHEKRTEGCTTEAMDWAAVNGHLDIVTFLHEKRSEGCTTEAMDWAAVNGYLDVVTFLHEKRTEGCTHLAMDDAAANGHLDVITFLHEKRSEGCTTEAMDWAAVNGHLDVVAFVHEMRSEGCTTEAMDCAATNGHLDVVTFLHEKRTEGCTTAALDGAAAEGHLDIVRFLVEHRDEGASLDVLDTAAANGHLDIVIYLNELGRFACTTAAVDDAAKNGHLDVVDYLLTHRREGASQDDAVEGALDNDHMEIVQRLVAAGYLLPSSSYIRGVLRNPGALALLQLYVAQGAALPSSWAEQVRHCGKRDVAEFYLQHTPEADHDPDEFCHYCDLDEMEAALSNDDFDAVSELWARRPELRSDCLLEDAVYKYESTKALAFLLDAGVGQPRSVAVQHIHPNSFEMITIVLPYCLLPNDPIDNLIFLVEWVHKRSSSFTKSPLLLLKAEMITQATAANCRNVHVGTEIEALTEALLERGATTSYLQPEYLGMQHRALFKSGIVDWGLATLFVHFLAVDANEHVEKLLKWLKMVTDVALKEHLQRLFDTLPIAPLVRRWETREFAWMGLTPLRMAIAQVQYMR